MKTSQINVLLNAIAAVGLTLGGASAIPGCNLPAVTLFWGLLLAGICKAVASTLVQGKGESDEEQGITPHQVAAKQAIDDHAVGLAPAPAPPGTAGTTTTSTTSTTSPAKALVILAFGLLCAGLSGCSTSAVSNGAAVNGAAVQTVDAAMTGWAAYTQQHVMLPAQILAVSNAYNAYYNSELVVSNLLTVYVSNPSTNTQALLLNATAAVGNSQSNIVALVAQFAK